MRGKNRRRKNRNERNTSAQRITSNAFSMFDKKQISELKEVFGFIDQDCDGFIDADDLLQTLRAVGEENMSQEYVKEMINESPSYINLTMFFTLFGRKLNGTDPDDVFEGAFRCLDTDGSGRIHGETLKRLLTQTGDTQTPIVVGGLTPVVIQSRAIDIRRILRGFLEFLVSILLRLIDMAVYRFTDAEINLMFKNIQLDSDGYFNYSDFIYAIRFGEAN